MAYYCAICGREHDPGVSCSASLVPEGKARNTSFAKTKRAADRFMVGLVVVALVIVLAVFVIIYVYHA